MDLDLEKAKLILAEYQSLQNEIDTLKAQLEQKKQALEQLLREGSKVIPKGIAIRVNDSFLETVEDIEVTITDKEALKKFATEKGLKWIVEMVAANAVKKTLKENATLREEVKGFLQLEVFDIVKIRKHLK